LREVNDLIADPAAAGPVARSNRPVRVPMAAIDNVRNAYQQGHLCLFIGAGVSISCGLPGWRDLASRIVQRAFQPAQTPLGQIAAAAEGRAAMPTIELDLRYALEESDPLDSMRLARRRLGPSFEAVVAESLYPLGDLTLSATVRAITTLSRIRRVLCFNYDDVLETAFEAAQRPFRCLVKGDSVPLLSEDTLIFHPHGYLPRPGRVHETATARIVLSEDDYHELYAVPYSWANMIELNLLLSHSALFVGCSLRDPNIRRLLDLVANLRAEHRHYALLPDPTHPEDKRWWVHNRRVEEQSLQTQELAGRGVIPLWWKEATDVERMLLEIAN
jgi:hypothetical protein